MSKAEIESIVISPQLFEENKFTVTRKDGEELGEFTIKGKDFKARTISGKEATLMNQNSAILFLVRYKEKKQHKVKVDPAQKIMYDLL